MALTYITISGQWGDGSGSSVTGTVTFTPSQTVYASGIPLVTPDVPVKAEIVAGQLQSSSGGTVQLLSTAQSGLTIQGRTGFWYWTAEVSVTSGGVTETDSWDFFLADSPSSVDLYSLASSGIVSSLYVLLTGDTMTGELGLPDLKVTGLTGATAASRYAGATASGAPVSGTFDAGDFTIDQTGKVWVCTAAGTPGTWAQAGLALDAAAADFQPDGTAAAGSTGEAADAGHVHPLQPWQFRPESYGAKGDGRLLGDVAVDGTTTITSASASFTSADVGKYIMIHGANGGAAGPLLTTIASVTNSTTAVLAAAAGATVSSCPAVYGTDDTTAVNDAVSAGKAYALANDYMFEVVFGPKIYILGTGPTQQTNPVVNAQVVVPWPDLTGAGPKLVAMFTGTGDAGPFQYWESVLPNVQGTALVSMTTAPSTADAVYGEQSVIGGPAWGTAFTGGFANVKPVVRGIQVVCGGYPNQYAFDFSGCAALRVQQSSAHVFAPPGTGGGTAPLLKDQLASLGNYIGCGLRTPVNGNNDDVTVDDFTAEGYPRGLYLFDHATCGRIGVAYADAVLVIDPTQGNSSTTHGVSVALLSAEEYNGGVLVAGGSAGTVPVYVRLDTENTAAPAYDVSDAGDALHGEIRWAAPLESRAPAVTGATRLGFVNDSLSPGVWLGSDTPAVPAAPASGVSQQNTSWRDATVLVTSTAAITAAAVDGNTVFSGSLTAGTPLYLRVPAGHSYTVTSAGGTLTTYWTRD